MTKRAALLLMVILAGLSCKKTVEGENKRWQRSTQQIQALTGLYPGFAAPLKARLTQAQALMDSAQQLSDKQAAANKMAEANSQLTSGFVGILGRIDGSMRSLREKVVTVSTSAATDTERQAAKTAADSAQRVLRSVTDLLKAGAADATAADAVARRVEADLRSADQSLDVVLRAQKERAQAAAKAQQAEAEAKRAQETAKEQATKPWKCEYCGHENPVSAEKCSNCGAPKPAK